MKKLSFIILLQIFGALSISAQVFDYIVAKDGSGDFETVQAAINACPDNDPKVIFIKNGTYNEKVSIGSHSQASNKKLSIIGEDAEKVVITWDDYNGKVVDGVTLGGTTCGTFIVNATDFYAENITIENTYTKSQAIALYNVGDRQTFKNCRLVGWQDTHRLRKGRRYYFYDCYIEGAVDYIYSGGPAIFDKCQLHTIKDGGYITAPEDVTYIASANGKKYIYCFIFRDCTLTAGGNYEYYLGRPWGTEAGAVFINSKTEGVKKEGWNIMGSEGTYLTSFFAEYNSTDMGGNPLDVSKRVDWSYQLTKEEIDTYYTPEKIYSFITGNAYDPFTLVEYPATPNYLRFEAGVLDWTAVSGAKGYIVYEDNEIIGFSAGTSFNLTNAKTSDSYSIKVVGAHGNLSEAILVGEYSGIEEDNIEEENIYSQNGVLYIPQSKKAELYSVSGSLLKKVEGETKIDVAGLSGLYLVKVETENGKIITKKLVF